MIIQLDHHCGVPIYRQIMDQVRTLILTGHLHPGVQLTPVRELAVELHVNPMTVSKAYSHLEVEGILERRRGVGLFVAGLSKSKRNRAQSQVLHSLLTKTAHMAIQMGIPPDEVHVLLDRCFRELSDS